MRKTIIKSILGGICIGMGVLVYSVQKNHIGAVLFSFGLINIIKCEFYLYTGKVGYWQSGKTVEFLTILLGNILGVAIIAPLIPDTTGIVQAKMQASYLIIFYRSLMCGMIIYLCVNQNPNKTKFLLPVLGVPLFILSGMEHCIADIGLLLGTKLSLQSIIFILVVIIGNSFGSTIFHRMEELCKE